MKFRILYCLYIAILILAISGFSWRQDIFGSRINSIVSPLPNFLTLFLNDQVSSLSLWIPSLATVKSKNISLPYVSAGSVLLYDLKTNKVLFQKNPAQKLPMASLTKIMTAIIALENNIEEVRVTSKDLVGENSMGLSEGEVLSLEEILYGLILHSGNDAAEAIASNYKGGRQAFIKAMNNKVKSLGLLNTNFTNPTGFEGDGSQYTTTYDLLVITKEALKYPLFAKVTSTFRRVIPNNRKHKTFYLENETNLLTSYPGVLGIKTGYTPEAGLCLVTYLYYKGHEIIGIILGSENRRQEMKDLLDYGLKIQGITPPPHG